MVKSGYDELKALYQSICDSEEYKKIDEPAEAREEKAKMREFFKQHFDNENFFTAVKLATAYAYTYEMRGFIIGYACAIRVASYCFMEGGEAND